MEPVTLEVLLKKYFGQCCAELFSEYGVQLSSASKRAASRSNNRVVGVIGFTGDRIKGSLILASTLTVAKATYPSMTPPGPEPSTELLVDWTGELANQLLGRIKNRILLHDVVLVMSTPVSLTGVKLKHAKLVMPKQNRIVMHASCGDVEVSVEAETEGPLEILAQPMGAEAGVTSEGDIVLF